MPSLHTAWASLKAHAKEHHASVNAAFDAAYGAGLSTSPASSRHATPATSPRQSIEHEHDAAAPAGARRASTASHENVVRKAAEQLKKRAKEHHKSVNAAYMSYYGVGLPV